MTYTNFDLAIDSDGIALLSWNVPDRSMNVITVQGIEELSAIVERFAAEDGIKGVVITSAKETFCAGADLTLLESLGRTFAALAREQGEEQAALRLFEGSRKLSLLYSRIETCGKPWVAALNGTAVGRGGQRAPPHHSRGGAHKPQTPPRPPEAHAR